MIDVEIVRHLALGALRRFEHHAGVLGLVFHLDNVAFAAAIARDPDAPAVDAHMAVADELPRREHGRHEFGAIDDGIETALEQTDQLFGSVAAKPRRLAIDGLELLLGDIAVIAFQLLLGAKLLAIIGKLAAAALSVLAGAIFALVIGALRPAPDILAEPSVDLVLVVNAFRHASNTPKSNQALSRGDPRFRREHRADESLAAERQVRHHEAKGNQGSARALLHANGGKCQLALDDAG